MTTVSRRLSNFLPTSELIRRRAPAWQIVHGLVFLAECLAEERKATIAGTLGHDSPLHDYIHAQDFKLKLWDEIVLAGVEDQEERLSKRSRYWSLQHNGDR